MEEETEETPPALLNQPELIPELAERFNAFLHFNASRPNSGFGLSPIPMTEIEAYIRIYEVEDRETFVSHIRFLDIRYLKIQSNK